MALIKCPECGKDISDKSDVCIHCGYPVKKDIIKNRYEQLSKEPCPKCNNLSWVAFENCGELFCCKCGFFHIVDQESYNKHKQQKQIQSQQEANKPKCPRCGSTEIQIVRKNWSIWSGFRTNDTERVCVKCKRKW